MWRCGEKKGIVPASAERRTMAPRLGLASEVSNVHQRMASIRVPYGAKDATLLKVSVQVSCLMEPQRACHEGV